MIEKDRIQRLNDKKIVNRKFVIYWMQASQRTEYNQALEFAIGQANKLGKPVIVFFGITDHYPSASLRHYAFMLEGLVEVRKSLEERGIIFVVPIQFSGIRNSGTGPRGVYGSSRPGLHPDSEILANVRGGIDRLPAGTG